MGNLRTLVAATAIAGPLVASGAWTAPALAGEQDQGNGIIQVDGRDFGNEPGNEPKVGCIFQVDFYNYDEGDTFADVRFELIPPTDEPDNTMRVEGDTRVFIGDDPANSDPATDGYSDPDGSETYTLSFSGPAAEQGYHVRLTVNAEGTNNADKRYKVYYVQCRNRFPNPSPSPSPGPGVTPTVINGGTAGDATGSGWLLGLGALLVSGAAGVGLRRRVGHES